jgi:hypothetical protein
VTIAIRPSCGCGTARGSKGDLPVGARGFLERADDRSDLHDRRWFLGFKKYGIKTFPLIKLIGRQVI